ncbi:unnamed protein product [Ectocarpus sp. 4 AP-2014]
MNRLIARTSTLAKKWTAATTVRREGGGGRLAGWWWWWWWWWWWCCCCCRQMLINCCSGVQKEEKTSSGVNQGDGETRHTGQKGPNNSTKKREPNPRGGGSECGRQYYA